VRFVYHEDYERMLTGVPVDALRSAHVLTCLTSEGLVREEDIAVPRRVSIANLLLVHTQRHLESVQRAVTLTRILGSPVADEEVEVILDLMRRMVGGTIQATRLALITGGVGVNLGGGFHHATADQGMGFCVFNDVAVAVARLRARGFAENVLVVDLDLHDGNGTRAIFADDPTVHTFSIHNTHWGDTAAVASTSIELGNDVDDRLYLQTLRESLPPVVESVDPGLVLYLAGADVAADDRIGTWSITPGGVFERDRFVLDLVHRRRRRTPVAIVLAGGYSPRAWTYPARFLHWLLTDRVEEPPDNEELVLRHFRRLKARLDPAALRTEPGDGGWRLTSEDLAGILPGIPVDTRFLGYLSRHGLELTLEEFGILRMLRSRGFPNPRVELDLSHPMGHTLRIWSDASRRELLVELRASRNRSAVPGMEVLKLEWLLLQNPRARFRPERPPLPGQQHPGLGMLKEVLGWLVMITEMAGLDGIYFVPSHYHVAAQSRSLVRFLDPVDEARFRALRRALDGIPLADATRLVEEGRVVDEHTGEPVGWEGGAMVLPVTDGLRDVVFSDDYEERVRDAERLFRYRLAGGAGREERRAPGAPE